jgi:hypothetical protein
MKMQIKRSELYATKGKVTLPQPGEENPHTMYELNETLVEIITKKYVGGSTDETTD